MSADFQDIPPWEGPDLLAEAREAARRAGEAAEPARSLTHAKPAAPRKERTWADVEAECDSAEARGLASIQTPARDLPAWLQKAREENARISARVQAERAAAGKSKHVSARCVGQAKLTEAQVVEVWKSTDTGASLAARYGVSAMTISNIRRGKLWGSLTATLGAPGMVARKRQGDGAGVAAA